MKDLTFINDGNPSKLKSLLNVEKLRMMAHRVQEIVSLGSALYPMERDTAIINWLQKPVVETKMALLKQKAIALEESH